MNDAFTACFIAAFLAAVMYSPSPQVFAMETDTSQPLFAKTTPIEMDLKFDFGKICHDPDSGRCEGLPATIAYSDDQGSRVRVDVTLRTRGRWGRTTGNCNIPALFVYFDSTHTEGTVFANQTMLPLTTHCRNYERTYQSYTMLEYLAYRYYNLLTDASLRVRLAHIRFRDTGNGIRLQRYGFFSEHVQNAAARLDAEYVNPETLDPREADPMEMATLAMFQYMIGNLDWSVVKSHNIAIALRGNGNAIALPFDFDYAGLVNAEYAVPPESMKAYNVRTRKYRGFCWPGLDWDALFARFLSKREQTMQFLDALPAVNNASLIATRRYLNEFFATIASSRMREKKIIEECRQLPTANSH